MQVVPAKNREENCTEKYFRGLTNQSGERLVNLYESNIFEAQVIFPV